MKRTNRKTYIENIIINVDTAISLGKTSPYFTACNSIVLKKELKDNGKTLLITAQPISSTSRRSVNKTINFKRRNIHYIKTGSSTKLYVTADVLCTKDDINLEAHENSHIFVEDYACYNSVSITTSESASVHGICCYNMVANSKGDSSISNITVLTTSILAAKDQSSIHGYYALHTLKDHSTSEQSTIFMERRDEATLGPDSQEVYSSTFYALPQIPRQRPPQLAVFNHNISIPHERSDSRAVSDITNNLLANILQISFDEFYYGNVTRPPPNNISISTENVQSMPAYIYKSNNSQSKAVTDAESTTSNEKKERRICCQICNNFPNAIFFPCNHAVMCFEHAKTYIKEYGYVRCSVCREEITVVNPIIFNEG